MLLTVSDMAWLEGLRLFPVFVTNQPTNYRETVLPKDSFSLSLTPGVRKVARDFRFYWLFISFISQADAFTQSDNRGESWTNNLIICSQILSYNHPWTPNKMATMTPSSSYFHAHHLTSWHNWHKLRYCAHLICRKQYVGNAFATLTQLSWLRALCQPLSTG